MRFSMDRQFGAEMTFECLTEFSITPRQVFFLSFFFFFSLTGRFSKSLQQITLQILPIFQPYADPHQSPINTLIRHRPPLNQRLDSTQTGRMLEEMQPTRQFPRHLLLFHGNRKHGAKSIRHLLFQPLPLILLHRGMEYLLQNRLDDSLLGARCRSNCLQCTVQPRHQPSGAVTLALDANFERSKTSHTEPRFHVSHDGSDKDPIREELFSPVLPLGGQHTT